MSHNSISPPANLPSLKSSLTEHLTVSQLKRKICDNGDIKQQQQDKIKSLVQQLKCAEYDIILVLDKYNTLEAELRSAAEAVHAESTEMMTKLKDEHAIELCKKDNLIKMLCDKQIKLIAKV